jgi:predicted 3-demethylubiquinone-9 3-methyltransferase (glyoxalase superfamily)
MQKVKTCLWFDGLAEEAAEFYTSVFPNSEIVDVSRHGDGGPALPGTAIMVRFRLDGTDMLALNGGSEYRFSEAISLVVDCDTQEEVDHYWTKLTENGGEESMCGWLKDRYGVSWQIVPRALPRLLQDPDSERSRRVIRALFQMRKIDIARLESALAG